MTINDNVTVPAACRRSFSVQVKYQGIYSTKDIRKHQYLKSHYHEIPFLSLNYKSMNSLIYL